MLNYFATTSSKRIRVKRVNGPSADKPVPGHEDYLVTRACVICSLVIHIDDGAPDGECPWVEHKAA